MEQRLGGLLRTTKVSRIERARMIAGAIFMPLLPGALGALAVAAAAAEDEPPMSPAEWGGLLLLIGLFGGYAVYTVAYAARFVGSTLTLHANGVVLTTRGRATVLLWEDITGWTRDVTHYHVAGIRARTVRVLTLLTRAGPKVRLPGAFEDATEIFADLETALTASKLPAARANVAAGLPLSFGPFIVGRDGLARGKRLVPWTEVGRHSLARGALSVETRGAPLTARYAKIPSAPVLCALVDGLRGGTRTVVADAVAPSPEVQSG